MMKLKEEIEKGKRAEFQIRDDDMIVKGQRMCVPEYGELERDIMEEAHSSVYSMHPGSTKMYKTLKEHYWWNGMKKEIASFVSRCLTYQQVKAEHQRPAGKIQLLPISIWKWEKITMDFVTGLPRTQRQHDAIWVIVDRLTKSAHFLLVNVEDSLEKLAQLYVDEIGDRVILNIFPWKGDLRIQVKIRKNPNFLFFSDLQCFNRHNFRTQS